MSKIIRMFIVRYMSRYWYLYLNTIRATELYFPHSFSHMRRQPRQTQRVRSSLQNTLHKNNRRIREKGRRALKITTGCAFVSTLSRRSDPELKARKPSVPKGP